MATAITALRRPTRSAWMVNLLARGEPEQLAGLIDLGEALRLAQEQLSGPDLRRLSADRHRAVEALTRRAVALAADQGANATEAIRREVSQSLQAALADPTTADLVRAGTAGPARRLQRLRADRWRRPHYGGPGQQSSPLRRCPGEAPDGGDKGRQPSKRQPSKSSRAGRAERRAGTGGRRERAVREAEIAAADGPARRSRGDATTPAVQATTHRPAEGAMRWPPYAVTRGSRARPEAEQSVRRRAADALQSRRTARPIGGARP